MTDKTADAAPFGRAADGRQAAIHILESAALRVAITDYGGRIVSIEAPDRQGRRDHVVLGFDCVSKYEAAGDAAFGALLGRDANRIADGQFSVDGQTFELSKNESGSTLHGGQKGFGKQFWEVSESGSRSLSLQLASPDGDQGFPGTVSVVADYRLEANTLSLHFTATTSKPTPLSLSAHPYFNLGGVGAKDILDHVIEIAAEHFLPTDARQIPTGGICRVTETPLDFLRPAAAGARIRQPDPHLLIGKGYDHYFILTEAGAESPRLSARASDPKSGRVLEILTTQPGLQFYTGNNLNGSIAGRGGAYRQSAGLAFEPQGFPDAPNHREFPTTILRPGETYRQSILYRFTTE